MDEKITRLVTQFRRANTIDNPFSAAWHLGFFKAASFVVVALPKSVFDDYDRRKDRFHHKSIA